MVRQRCWCGRSDEPCTARRLCDAIGEWLRLIRQRDRQTDMIAVLLIVVNADTLQHQTSAPTPTRSSSRPLLIS